MNIHFGQVKLLDRSDNDWHKTHAKAFKYDLQIPAPPPSESFQNYSVLVTDEDVDVFAARQTELMSEELNKPSEPYQVPGRLESVGQSVSQQVKIEYAEKAAGRSLRPEPSERPRRSMRG